ncbi:hypothetical protein [Salirhabdus sp. Marseille-P4669]|uniref:hypothetical protein n=1 Tax=Salirhabdus sp. Marseille-P4669 TaxID=2042310 RepID=UPI000C7DF56B|nr:hypothetical protein [Salirhabdus sp. Marseille-P4669]
MSNSDIEKIQSIHLSAMDKKWRDQLDNGWLGLPIGLEGIDDVFWARNYYFLAFKYYVPRAIMDLEKLLTTYSELLDEMRKKGVLPVNKYVWNLLEIHLYFKKHSSLITRSFLDDLSTWCLKYNFDLEKEKWIIDEIPKVLSSWLKNSEHRANKTFMYKANYGFDKIEIESKIYNEFKLETAFTPKLPITHYTLEQYLDLATKHYKMVIGKMMNNGYKIVRNKINFEHFIWLVLYKNKKYSYKDVAYACNVALNENSAANIIGRPIKKLSKTTGLIINKASRGRPSNT